MNSNSNESVFVKSDFDESQQARKERFKDLAEKNNEKSNGHYDASKKAVEHIPMGQPILIGHHSQGRHERDLAKADNNMRKSIECDAKAKHYARKAKSVGTNGVASDNPEAINLLEKKLKGLEESHAIMKNTNAEFRKGGWDNVKSLTIKQVEKLKQVLGENPRFKQPFESYSLTNNNANIRSTRKRLEELKKLRNEKPFEFENEDYHFYIDDGRICISFSGGKPSDEVRKHLKSKAFRWSRYNERWQRKYTHNALRSSKWLLEDLNKIEEIY